MYTLGIDLSTQSVSATILQQVSGHTEALCCGSWSIPFRKLAAKYQLDTQTLCVPGLASGFFAQEPQMFLESIDLLLARMQADSAPLSKIAALNCSAQQHGQVWLNEKFPQACAQLQQARETDSLSKIFATSYAYPLAPIWMCSQTEAESRHLLKCLGKERILQLIGSAAPLRFSGLVLRWLAQREPLAYEHCVHVHLLSSWLAALFSGTSAAPVDWGNAAGTALMDYRAKAWSDELLGSLAEGLSGGSEGLRVRLPKLLSPLHTVGKLAPYFGKYGLPMNCKVLVGSGDNPQTKVCQQGELLSLGSSFVLMSQAESFHPWANAMYDGLGQAFSFACRTNGALVWDAYRKHCGLSFVQQEEALAATSLGSVKPQAFRLLCESFPPGAATVNKAEEFQGLGSTAKPGANLAAIIDGTLQELHQACIEVFGKTAAQNGAVLYLTGGPTQSPQILRRIESIWQRPVQTFHSAGASYGAAKAALNTAIHCN